MQPVTRAIASFTCLLTGAIGQSYRSVDDTATDPLLSTVTAPFLAIPGYLDDLVRAGGGQFVELPNGTARLTGRVFSQSNLYIAFLFDIELSGRVAPGDPSYPPPNAPQQGLLATAYAPQGSIDPATFVYYTNATGRLTGVRNLTGAILDLVATAPVQLGDGANNRNGSDGMFGSFAATVTSQAPWNPIAPTGDVTLAAEFVAPYSEDTSHPQIYTPITTLATSRAMALPGVADDYVFVPAGSFVEAHDGTATLDGQLVRLDDLDDGWQLTLALGGRVDPGEAAWPPAGSPVLQLLPQTYHSAGGPIDPDHWHYYTQATGTLLGTGSNAGAVIDLSQAGAVQVGAGANQLNTYFGYYGALVATVSSQPTQGSITLTGDIELHGLTAVFPVLPFPSLVVPPTPPMQPTLSPTGVVLAGDNLAWLGLVGVGSDLLGTGDADDLLSGWFEVLDNTHIEVHAPVGITTGSATVVGYNPAVLTNAVTVDYVEPTTPTLLAEAHVGNQGTIHLRMHPGPLSGPAVALMTLSSTLTPTTIPGVVSLDLGAANTDLIVDPNAYTYEPTTGIAAIDYGPISATLLGQTLYFEAVVVELAAGSLVLPLPASNARTITFQ